MVLPLVFLLLAAAPAWAGDEATGLFGTLERQSTNMGLFTNWTKAVERSLAEKSAAAGSCTSKPPTKCHYQMWMTFLDGLQAKDKTTQLTMVNDYMNRARYITDEVNYGVSDYWASPGQFFEKQGDCEDYAIAKYFSLRLLGWPVESLRVVAVQDLNLKVGHAVMAAYLDGKTYILDNQIKQVVDHKTIRHYQPVFSINEKAWWRHTGKP